MNILRILGFLVSVPLPPVLGLWWVHRHWPQWDEEDLNSWLFPWGVIWGALLAVLVIFVYLGYLRLLIWLWLGE